jgi:hypothetical protein
LPRKRSSEASCTENSLNDLFSSILVGVRSFNA